MAELLRTAQDAYRLFMKEQVAPAMRHLGFKGSGGKFRIVHGDYEAHVDALKSRYSSKSEVEFTFDLSVVHTPSPSPNGIWSSRLGHLMPSRRDTWWTITPTSRHDELSEAVISALTLYGWLAMQAAIDGGDMPVVWFPRTNELEMTPQERDINLRRRAMQDFARKATTDQLFELLTDEISRFAALREISYRALNDPRSLPLLVEVLASDPDKWCRRMACDALTHIQGHPEVDSLLTSAINDEDQEVRWQARYALKLRKLENQ